jgi:hypothetical protein
LLAGDQPGGYTTFLGRLVPLFDLGGFHSAHALRCGGAVMTLPPIIGRGPPRMGEARGRKAGSPDFSVPEAPDSPATDVAMGIAAVTPLLALQAEGGLQPAPALTLAQVAGGATRQLDRLQLALLRGDRIPDDLLDALAEAADHLAQADQASAAEWRPLLMRIKVELARYSPVGRVPGSG